MSKRQHDDDIEKIDINPVKQIRLITDEEHEQTDGEDSHKKLLPTTETEKMVILLKQEQQLNEQQQKKKLKDPQEIALKGRRRMSGAQRFPHGGNIWDPLNLRNIKPTEPNGHFHTTKSNEIAQTNVKVATTEGQQSKGVKRRLPHWDVLHQQSFASTHMMTTPRKPYFPNVKNKPWINQQQKASKQLNSTEVKEEKGEQHQEQPTTSSTQGTYEQDAMRTEHKKRMRERYRYGNFNHYKLSKEFCNPSQIFDQFIQSDPRVDVFCPDWFVNKSILDIGCNSGRFTISLARRFHPKRIIGIDIDQHLIGAARKNIRHFTDKDTKLIGRYPASFFANFGPISAPSTSSGPHFPDNIWFFCENYVLKSDDDLDKVEEEYDIIFALALTKWVHLNWGDAGIKRFFHRVFRQLRTGGRFVLETAAFKDYKKHCNKKGNDRPPEEVLEIFHSIQFHPEEFTDFLLTTVGFSHHEELNIHHSKHLGISGRLQVFYKGKFMLTDTETTHEISLPKERNNDTEEKQQKQL